MTQTRDPARSARGRASAALGLAAASFPQLDPAPLDTAGLDPRDARLALAIHRLAIQRWLTLEHLLDAFLRQKSFALEPALRGLLLSAAAQIFFLDRIPAHAVVDESVDLARRTIRPGAAGLVNAVLRRLAELRGASHPDQPWAPAPDRLPLDLGSLALNRPSLPDPADLPLHLSLATSHPLALVQSWIARFGQEAAAAIALHGIVTPPTIVAVEPGFDVHAVPAAGASPPASPASPADPASATLPFTPHDRPGFVVWTGDHDGLVAFLLGHRERRVQDPASTLAVASTAKLPVRVAIDYCAGRGTKTRQLALLHPKAQIVATDADSRRVADLRVALAPFPNVTACHLQDLGRTLAGRRADLLLLDVPCSNTGVLARRPEARYRFSPESLASLLALQRSIIDQASPLLAPGGAVLYSTCSLEKEENQGQARGILARAAGELLAEHVELPAGRASSYHDGSYHALIRVAKPPAAVVVGGTSSAAHKPAPTPPRPAVKPPAKPPAKPFKPSGPQPTPRPALRPSSRPASHRYPNPASGPGPRPSSSPAPRPPSGPSSQSNPPGNPPPPRPKPPGPGGSGR